MSYKFNPFTGNFDIAGSAGPEGKEGPAGKEGKEGKPGSGSGFPYTYVAGGSEVPATGTFTTNNATPSLVTKIYLNVTDAEGNLRSEWFGELLAEAGGVIQLSFPARPNVFMQFQLPAHPFVPAEHLVITCALGAFSAAPTFSTETKGTLITIIPTGVGPWEAPALNAGVQGYSNSENAVGSGLQATGIRNTNFGAVVEGRGAVQVIPGKTVVAGKAIVTVPAATSTHPTCRPPGLVTASLNTALAVGATCKLTENSTSLGVPKATCEALTVGDLVFGTGIPEGTYVIAISAAEEKVTLSQKATATAENELTFLVPKEPILATVNTNGNLRAMATLAEKAVVFLDKLNYNTT